jgi:phi13 family phage major tail protein
MPENKVHFGLKNAYYAKITRTVSDGVVSITFGTPKALPGSVSLSLDPSDENTIFYADDTAYYTVPGIAKYEGDYETASVTRDFKKDIFGDIEDENGALVEVDGAETSDFAFLVEYSGDVGGQRQVFYNCSASRPAAGSATKEESTEVQTQTITITAKTSEKGYVTGQKAVYPVQTYLNVGDEGYDTFFSSVYEPDFTASNNDTEG